MIGRVAVTEKLEELSGMDEVVSASRMAMQINASLPREWHKLWRTTIVPSLPELPGQLSYNMRTPRAERLLFGDLISVPTRIIFLRVVGLLAMQILHRIREAT